MAGTIRLNARPVRAYTPPPKKCFGLARGYPLTVCLAEAAMNVIAILADNEPDAAPFTGYIFGCWFFRFAGFLDAIKADLGCSEFG